MTELRYPREARLLTPADFSRVMDGADLKVSSAGYLLLARRSDSLPARLGFIIARKKVKRAVDRNRIKRCFRENFRLQLADFPPMDIVFLARQDVGRLDHEALHDSCRESFRKLLRKAAQLPADADRRSS